MTAQKEGSPTRRSRKIPDLPLAFWRDQCVWSSSFSLPSWAAHSAQEFKIELLGVFKIGLLGDVYGLRCQGTLSPSESSSED